MTAIQRLTDPNYDEIFALSEFAFQYQMNEEERSDKEKEAARHRIFGYFVDEELAGKLHIIPLEVFIQGVRYPMGGISSVATWPEFRRQGVAKNLLKESLKDMKNKGETISLLHPFNVGFYRKYGWELAFYRKRYTLPIEKLKHNWKTAGYVRKSQDVKALLRIYEDYAKSYNGMLARDELWWEQRVLTKSHAQIRVAYDPKGNEEAYIIYTIRKNILTVIDMAYRSNNGLHLMYEFLSNHDSMAEKVELTVPKNDLLPLMLNDPAFSQILEPYFMARIVDVKQFLQAYPFKGDNKTIVLEVTDDVLPENDGCYTIKTTNQGATVTKIKQQSGASISCSIQQLTSLLLGFVRAPDVWKQEFIAGDESSVYLLDDMIPQQIPYFADFF